MRHDSKFIDAAIKHDLEIPVSYNYTLIVDITEEGSEAQYRFRKDSAEFTWMGDEEYHAIKGKKTEKVYRFTHDNENGWMLELYLYTSKRFEGVSFRVDVSDEGVEIVNESMDLICMLP